MTRRYDSSGGAFGYYDHALTWDLGPLGASNLRLNSELGNTLILDIPVANGSMEIFFDYSEIGGERDIVVFEDITSTQATFAQNGLDLVISVAGGGSVTINDHFSNPLGTAYEAVELFAFSDFTVIGADEVRDLIGQLHLGNSGMNTLTPPRMRSRIAVWQSRCPPPPAPSARRQAIR